MPSFKMIKIVKKNLNKYGSNCRYCGLTWIPEMDKSDGVIIILNDDNLLNFNAGSHISFNGYDFCKHWTKEVPLNIKELNKQYAKIKS